MSRIRGKVVLWLMSLALIIFSFVNGMVFDSVFVFSEWYFIVIFTVIIILIHRNIFAYDGVDGFRLSLLFLVGGLLTCFSLI